MTQVETNIFVRPLSGDDIPLMETFLYEAILCASRRHKTTAGDREAVGAGDVCAGFWCELWGSRRCL